MLRNMILGARLGLAFGMVLVLLAGVGVLAIDQMGVLSSLNQKMYRHPFTVRSAVLRVSGNIAHIERAMKDVALARQPAQVDRAVAEIRPLVRAIDRDFRIIADRFLGEKRMYQRAERLWRMWRAIRREVQALKRAGRHLQAADVTRGKGAGHVRKIFRAMAALSDFAEHKAVSFYRDSQRTLRNARLWLVVIVVLAVLVGVIFTILITRSVAGPAREIAAVSEAIAGGDLNRKILYHGRDEIGRMAESLRRMLTGVIGEGQSIKNGLPIPLWTTDRNLTLTSLNPAAADLAASLGGLKPEQIVGRMTIDEILRDQAGLAADQARTILHQTSRTVEDEVCYQVGEEQHYFHRVMAPLRDLEGAAIGVMGVALDVTDRRRAAAEWEALIAELEAQNAELERFTYTVSHDLKSPLITIKGFLGLLTKDAAKGDVARLEDDVARIANAADKMHTLLDELLELSRVGRLISPPEDVPLVELAREAMDLVHGRLEDRGVEVDISPDLPRVRVDRPRLREVLENLIDNAVKFMGDQAQPRVEIGVRQDGEETVFFVRDNGMGIEPQYRDRVFGLFDKLDPASDGTGVGLALVKRIVEVHGGRIWIESPGASQGTTVAFTLPPGSGKIPFGE